MLLVAVVSVPLDSSRIWDTPRLLCAQAELWAWSWELKVNQRYMYIRMNNEQPRQNSLLGVGKSLCELNICHMCQSERFVMCPETPKQFKRIYSLVIHFYHSPAIAPSVAGIAGCTPLTPAHSRLHTLKRIHTIIWKRKFNQNREHCEITDDCQAAARHDTRYTIHEKINRNVAKSSFIQCNKI